MRAMFWLLILLVAGATSFVLTLPLQRRVAALESMCEMLAKAVQEEKQTKG